MKNIFFLALFCFVLLNSTVKSRDYRRTPICYGDWGRRSMDVTNFKDEERRKNDWSLQMEIPEDEQLFTERPTVVGIHGWKGFSNFRRNQNALGIGFQMVSDAFKRHKNVNYVSAKWKNGFSFGYNGSVLALEAIGHGIVNWLNINLGYDRDIWKNLTLVGFSLGAHIAGWVGRTAKNRVGTIIGLDAARPQFELEVEGQRLDKSDAEYVECLHTSTDCYGIKGAYCHSDFYANYGSNQPGCLTKIGKFREFDCDHYRAYEIYAESISTKWSFRALKCTGLTTSVCSYKESEHFGGYPNKGLDNKVNGIYIFFTNKEYPYRQASPFDHPEF